VSPPHVPFAPALEAQGVALNRMLIVRTGMPLWAHEQALRSGACEMALAWLPRASPRAVRRLQLAAEQGRALGVLYRSQRYASEASPAMLRVMLEPLGEGKHGARVRLLKSRGGSREPIELQWTAAAA
jgi:cell division inhibitor SulA/protein ImuA